MNAKTELLRRLSFVILWAVFEILQARAQSPPSFTTQPTNQTVTSGTSVTLVATVTGGGPYSYQWQLNGTNLPNTITTVAGTGVGAYSGDGRPATNASLYWPCALAFDPVGDLIISDYENNRIRRIDSNGVISTIVGNGMIRGLANGVPIPNGDGGAATNACVDGARGVACDAMGNLYIAGGSIRMVGTNGIVTTLVPDTAEFFAGDGGPATNASVYDPASITVDSFGNVFIADTGNLRVRRIDTNGVITTVAGNGFLAQAGEGGAATNAAISEPCDVPVDGWGSLFILNGRDSDIFKVDTN